jgi:large subunit ribosomal protein L29
MENKDIIALSVQELKDKIREEKANLNKMHLNHSVSPLESPIKIRHTRRTIAKLSTELTKKTKA